MILQAKIFIKEKNKEKLKTLQAKFQNNFPEHPYKKIIEKFLHEE